MWPSAVLALLRALRPANGRPSARAVLEICVTMDSKKCHCIALCKAPISFPLRLQQNGTAMAARICAAKVQRFRKGDLVDSR